MKINELIQKEEAAKQVLNDNLKTLRIFSFIRLLLIILIFASFILAVSTTQLYFIAFGVFIVLFYFVSKIHSKYFSIEDVSKAKLALYKSHIKRLNSSWKDFSDTGKKNVSDKDFFLSDLDVFGKDSLFQRINMSKTYYGRLKFENSLKNNTYTKNDFKLRQEAIHELGSDREKNDDLAVSLLRFKRKIGKTQPKFTDTVLKEIDNDYNFNKLYLAYSIISVISMIVLIILASLQIVFYMFPVGLFILNLILAFSFSRNINDLNKTLGYLDTTLYGYNYIFKEISSKNYTSTLLVNIKEDVTKVNNKAFRELKIIGEFVGASNNIIFSLVFNGLFNLDCFSLAYYSRWQKLYSKDLSKAVREVGDTEEFLSLSMIEYLYDVNCRPILGDNFSFTDLVHPLLLEDKCIPNSFTYLGFNIITGSNMSGKTTFLRTLGLNYILANAGSSVPGTSFIFKHVRVLTSLRATDDISNGISTFYAEIIRIKTMINSLKEDTPLLVLVDEIFKGTNTTDRIKGSVAAIKRLNQKNVYGFVTTHDSELTDLSGMYNYHFLEHYQGDEILFDYKIKTGKSNTKNAIFLMRLAGIIE